MGCIRAAMDLGTNLVLPTFQLRNTVDINDIYTNKETPTSFLFDTSRIIYHLKENCPDFHVVESIDQLPNATITAVPAHVQPNRVYIFIFNS